MGRLGLAGTAIALAVLGPAGHVALAAPKPPPRPPLVLPGDATAASVRADRGTWLVGARPGAAAARAARRHGARPLGIAAPGGYVVPRTGARALAADLRARGLLVSAEPNRLGRSTQSPLADPLSPLAAWRDHVVSPALPPPPVRGDSPLIALLDTAADLRHGEWAGGNATSTGTTPIAGSHGTATAAVAAAPKNDVGILGVWPGARARNYALPEQITCADVVRQVGRAIEDDAAVINMSFGSETLCFEEFAALQTATGRGIVLVAAAGNEFAEGNPLEFPASLPHVLTVAALTPDRTAAFFSNANEAMDLGAPGVGIVTAVPPAFDTDGVPDGYQALSGTSFAAPMVAAAAAWVRAARPELSGNQVAEIVRSSASDVEDRGWDPATGFGMLSVDAALASRTPLHDRTEPNDDIIWIDGTVFDDPDAVIWRGSGTRRFTAVLDKFEDPADVYRIRLPAKGTAHISVRSRFGAADLAVFSPRAETITQTRFRIDRSRRPGRRTDRVGIANRGRKAGVVYVAVPIDERASTLDAAYELTVRR